MLLYLLFKCVLNGAGINFALAFMWALVWCNQNIYYLAVALIAAAFAAWLPLLTVAAFAGSAALLVLIFFIHKTARKKLNLWLLNVYLAVCQIPFFLLVGTNMTLAARLVVNIMLTQIFFNAAVNFLQPLVLRRAKFKLNADEALSGIVLIIMFAAGLSQLKIGGAYAGAFVPYFAILILTFAFKNAAAVMAALCFGAGYIVAGEGAAMMGMFALFALALFAFCKLGRYYAATAAVLVSSCLVFFFKIVTDAPYVNAAIPALAAVLCLFIKPVYFNLARDYFGGQNRTAAQALAFYSKKSMQKRLTQASDCFLAIEKAFSKNIKQTADTQQAQQVLSAQLVDSMCKKCGKYTLCYNSSDVPAVINKMVSNALVRGKATILDVPPFFSAKCKNMGEVLASANDLAVKYLKFNTLQKNNNTGAEIVMEQMRELSAAVLRISDELTRKAVFNDALAQNCEAALVYANMPVTEVVCEESGAQNLTVTVSFGGGSYIDKAAVKKIVSKAARCKMEAVAAGESENSIVLAACPPCDAVFGLAGEAKAGSSASGDTHAFLRLSGGKILFALCDGMGSGDKAARVSSEAIELIETFYRAGLSSSTILNSANKLLSFGGGEDFAAIDICVLDLFVASASFFKLASPESVVAGDGGFSIIEGGALPIGASISALAKTHVHAVSTGDMIVQMTDGVRDAFANTAEIVSLIEQVQTTNPQVLADCILAAAKNNNGGALADDATVMCVRVFERV